LVGVLLGDSVYGVMQRLMAHDALEDAVGCFWFWFRFRFGWA
jgi:xanthosine utilization system XapX-like protein